MMLYHLMTFEVYCVLNELQHTHVLSKISVLNPQSQMKQPHMTHLDFVQKYERWYKIQNHGGLQKPCDTFFLLVRELELVVRKSVTAKLSANSLLLGPLKATFTKQFNYVPFLSTPVSDLMMLYHLMTSEVYCVLNEFRCC
jgi:hypothetical protein